MEASQRTSTDKLGERRTGNIFGCSLYWAINGKLDWWWTLTFPITKAKPIMDRIYTNHDEECEDYEADHQNYFPQRKPKFRFFQEMSSGRNIPNEKSRCSHLHRRGQQIDWVDYFETSITHNNFSWEDSQIDNDKCARHCLDRDLVCPVSEHEVKGNNFKRERNCLI